jgi:hydroxymethylbilane synthase
VTQSSGVILRLGSRGSPLARAQADMVRQALAAAHGFPVERVEIQVIRTSGDRIQDRPLADVGGKGLFTKEIEEALAAGAIDLAVHSSKDMPTVLPAGLVLTAFLPREDARDAFISRKAESIAALAPAATVGTASLPRQAQGRRLRPELQVVPLRGNVETRLRRIDEGMADATLLALAGLKRLGLTGSATAVLGVDEFLPAVGQGAIGIETRGNDDRTHRLLEPINHADTAIALTAERSFLATLDGSCRTPIAGHATVTGGELRFRGMILKPDGSEAFETARTGTTADAARLGDDAGRELRARAGPDFLLGL